MDPGLFFAGIMGGLLIAIGWQGASDPPVPQVGGGHEDPSIAKATKEFLPTISENIQLMRASFPDASDWKKMAAHMPYLTEAVAMYFTLADPRTPLQPKLMIAGSLLYLISPLDVIPDAIPGIGQLDDIGVLLLALDYVYDVMDEAHFRQAQTWLRSQGIEPKPLFAIGKDFSVEEQAYQEPAEKMLLIGSPKVSVPDEIEAAAPFNGW